MCPSGISGDMTVGALIHAGMPIDYLREEVSKLGLGGLLLDAKVVEKAHIAACKFSVTYPEEKAHRHLSDISKIIEESSLSDRVKGRALGVFRRLAEAEAYVHNTTPDEIHFHEVGAVDAIVDIVGTAVGLEYFGVESVVVSPVCVGYGTVNCEHGVMPVPAPATAELLRGFPTYAGDLQGEMTTPTGASIIAALADRSGQQPPMVVETIGYGAGDRDLARPNVLRVSIGSEDHESAHPVTDVYEMQSGVEQDRVVMIETEIDDMIPETVPPLMERLMTQGALDAHYFPVVMKKGRPGISLRVIGESDTLPTLLSSLFRETTTLGCRVSRIDRAKLLRKSTAVETGFGEVHVKAGILNGEVVTVSPEYRDCLEASRRTGTRLIDVYRAALEAYGQEQREENLSTR